VKRIKRPFPIRSFGTAITTTLSRTSAPHIFTSSTLDQTYPSPHAPTCTTPQESSPSTTTYLLLLPSHALPTKPTKPFADAPQNMPFYPPQLLHISIEDSMHIIHPVLRHSSGSQSFGDSLYWHAIVVQTWAKAQPLQARINQC
jgi:hypothetical protein